MEEGRGTHSYIVPLQLEDEVLVLVAQVMLHVCGQQQSLAKAFYNLTPPKPLLQVRTNESLGRDLSPTMKVHYHPVEGGTDVEATLDPTITG